MLLLSIYILTAAARGQLHNEPLGAVLMWIIAAVASRFPGHGRIGSADFATTTIRWRDFKAENERLRKRIQNLEVERQRLLEAEATNQRLQQLLDFRSHLPGTAITASIIANSASSWFQS